MTDHLDQLLTIVRIEQEKRENALLEAARSKASFDALLSWDCAILVGMIGGYVVPIENRTEWVRDKMHNDPGFSSKAHIIECLVREYVNITKRREQQ